MKARPTHKYTFAPPLFFSPKWKTLIKDSKHFYPQDALTSSLLEEDRAHIMHAPQHIDGYYGRHYIRLTITKILKTTSILEVKLLEIIVLGYALVTLYV